MREVAAQLEDQKGEGGEGLGVRGGGGGRPILPVVL